MALCLQADSSSSPSPQRGPCVIMCRAERRCPAPGGAAGQGRGCVVDRNFEAWPWPQGNLRLFGTENYQTQQQTLRGSERASILMGLCSDPGDVVWPFSTWSCLLLLQHACFRGSFGDAIRDVSGFSKWEVPPCHPRAGESGEEPGRWRMRWLIKVVSGSWPHCVPHSQRDPLTGQQPRILSQIPQIPDTQRRCPGAGARSPRKAGLFLSPCVVFTCRQMGLLYPRELNRVCFWLSLLISSRQSEPLWNVPKHSDSHLV